MDNISIKVTADTDVCYPDGKPSDLMGLVQVQVKGCRDMTPEEFINYMTHGGVCRPAACSGEKGEGFVSQQLFAIDFDNGEKDKDTSMFIAASPEERRDVEDIIADCERIGVKLWAIYATYSDGQYTDSSGAPVRRLRALFLTDRPVTDISERNAIQKFMSQSWDSSVVDRSKDSYKSIFLGTNKGQCEYLTDASDALNDTDSLLEKSKHFLIEETEHEVDQTQSPFLEALRLKNPSIFKDSKDFPKDLSALGYDTHSTLEKGVNLSALLHWKPRKAYRCILHDDLNPSANVFQHEDGAWLYKCHSTRCPACGGMNIIDFTKEYGEFCSKDEAKMFLTKMFGLPDKSSSVVQTPNSVKLPRAICIDDVEPKEISYLVEPYISRGNITFLSGSGGVGKSFVMMQVMAALSKGSATIFDMAVGGFKFRLPHKSLFITSEDAVAEVIRPRLDLYEVGKGMICVYNLNEAESELSVDFGSHALEMMIRDTKPDLVVFDPLQSFIPSKLSMGDRNAMRHALNPVSRLAKELNIAVVIICHTNKRDAVSGRNRMADSTDFWDMARAVLMVGEADDGLKYLSLEKNNYSAPAPTILFSINEKGVQFVRTTNKKDADYTEKRSRYGATSTKTAQAEQRIIDIIMDEGDTVDAFKASHPNEFTDDFYEDLDPDDIILSSKAFDSHMSDFSSKQTYVNARRNLSHSGAIKNNSCGNGQNHQSFVVYPRPKTLELEL